LDHGRHILGPTVETTLLCHAVFVLTGRRSTSQGPMTSLQDPVTHGRRKHKIVVGVLNPQFMGETLGVFRIVICQRICIVNGGGVPLWFPMPKKCVNRFSNHGHGPINSKRIKHLNSSGPCLSTPRVFCGSSGVLRHHERPQIR
jgi:hypothetical protein